nr:helix-turn-helix domain-containing protein [Pelomicrobium methylotrophicum]
MTPKDAQRRLQILRFWERHGLSATRDAFGVSRRTLYRWKKALKDAGFNPAALAAKSCAPKRRRRSKTSPRLVAEIRRLRTLYPGHRQTRRSSRHRVGYPRNGRCARRANLDHHGRHPHLGRLSHGT